MGGTFPEFVGECLGRPATAYAAAAPPIAPAPATPGPISALYLDPPYCDIEGWVVLSAYLLYPAAPPASNPPTWGKVPPPPPAVCSWILSGSKFPSKSSMFRLRFQQRRRRMMRARPPIPPTTPPMMGPILTAEWGEAAETATVSPAWMTEVEKMTIVEAWPSDAVTLV